MNRRTNPIGRILAGAIRSGASAAALAALLAAAAAGPLAAQTANPAPTPPAETAKPAAKPATGGSASGTEVDELVVTVDPTQYRNQPGHALGEIPPELELSPSVIQSYGVSSVNELLTELAPQISSNGARTAGGPPVTLLAGRRISSPNEIRDIPTEAILRVDILPEAAALTYGFPPDQRVVNIVLRPSFQVVTGEVQGGGPTEGGQENGQVEASVFRVRGDTRTNFDLKYQASSSLTEAARGLTEPPAGAPFAIAGNVTSAIPGAEIDPALSALAGQPVTVAGVPATAAGRARVRALSDFAATANLPYSEDVGRYRTLSPATQDLSANLVLSRNLPAGFSGTVNATLEATTSDTLQGLPSLGLTVPAGDPFSPFGSAVQVDRYVNALGPLRQSVDGWTGHLGATLNRDAGPWRFSLTGAYDHADSATAGDTGLDPTAMQALLNSDSASFNPFAAPPAALLTKLARATARSLADTGNAQVLANGPLLEIPAGALNIAVKFGDTESAFDTRSLRLGLAQAADLSRNDLNAQVHFDLPLTSRRNGFLPMMGELSVNLTLAVDQLSDFGTLRSTGYGLNWNPMTGANFNLSYTNDQAAPTVQQLGNPVVQTPGVRLLDFATGQTVDVTQVAGGNAALSSDRRQLMRVGLALKPLPKEELNINLNYFDLHIDDPIVTFPAATAQIEAAFPDRFIRDADGDLETVDYRPVNFSWQETRGVSVGLNYSRAIRGPAPQRPPGAPNGPGGAPQGPQPQGSQPQGPQIGQLQFALYDTIFFTDQLLVRPGGPLLDRLDGAALGGNGGRPVHQVNAQAGYTLNGLGARMSLTWMSGTSLQGVAATPTGTLSFSDLATVNLRLFADFSQMRATIQQRPWLRGVRLTLSVNNLADERIRVRDASGVTPLSYQPAYLDPTGRSITLNLRKLFY